jgi:hypothetical protein
MVNAAVTTVGSATDGVARRSAARIRASSSLTPNGLVM